MKTIIITGAGGLIGSEATEHFCLKGWKVIGIENDTRSKLFGPEGSTKTRIVQLLNTYKTLHIEKTDIRNQKRIEKIFQANKIDAIIHTAAQPSHDWAAKDPKLDFQINAVATLNLLEATRKYCPEAPFLFTSTNKVYGDNPNQLPLEEKDKRIEINKNHKYHLLGIDENLSIDHCIHSLFGVSKTAADLLVQEYGRYFHIPTACFRAGCLTGPNHQGVELHGFLSYLVKQVVSKKTYKIIGHNGKQVRDNIHSKDLIAALSHFIKNPKVSKVYNIGGGRENSCSILEALEITEEISGKTAKTSPVEISRTGDHQWWISDYSSFQKDYPNWKIKRSLRSIITELINSEQK